MLFRLSAVYALLAVLTTALGSGVLVPLYIDPADTSCSAWTPLLNAISAHPAVPFYVIINPNSGPVPTPDTGYQTCIPRLKASPSVTVVGYVPTTTGAASIDAVNSATAQYAAWGSAYRPQGIFFDEVNPTSRLLSKYTNWTNTAKATLNDGHGYVILNPGASVGSQTTYFNIADQIVTAEDFYDQFSPSQLTFSSSSPAAKQAVILTDAPSAPPASLISQLVATDNIGSLYITDDTQANGANPYDTLPTQFATFVADIGTDTQ
ncbi:Spherulation-specific family 4 [Irpex rosettiformis]|uniref:Spherulation-specific family 4 n=1 Tax=Irpex rosettiformis TaxID=378272 RepID=A0ACB8UCE5_9APHY|nr:Spherulation-specific family 4 [Irpex rosettiformis]